MTRCCLGEFRSPALARLVFGLLDLPFGCNDDIYLRPTLRIQTWLAYIFLCLLSEWSQPKTGSELIFAALHRMEVTSTHPPSSVSSATLTAIGGISKNVETSESLYMRIMISSACFHLRNTHIRLQARPFSMRAISL